MCMLNFNDAIYSQVKARIWFKVRLLIAEMSNYLDKRAGIKSQCRISDDKPSRSLDCLLRLKVTKQYKRNTTQK